MPIHIYDELMKDVRGVDEIMPIMFKYFKTDKCKCGKIASRLIWLDNTSKGTIACEECKYDHTKAFMKRLRSRQWQ